VLGKIQLSGIAKATGARYVPIEDNGRIAEGIGEALGIAATDQPAIVDVRIDYSKRTRFTQGVVKSVLRRFPMRDRLRFVSRALIRKVTG
jgi:acetolactate synthase-1/2/3 large subunit